MVLTRDEFVAAMAAQYGKIGDDHNMWAYEKHIDIKCKYFVCVRPNISDAREDYWRWINKNVPGTVICYIAGEESSWWGFTEPDSIELWLLKWA